MQISYQNFLTEATWPVCICFRKLFGWLRYFFGKNKLVDFSIGKCLRLLSQHSCVPSVSDFWTTSHLETGLGTKIGFADSFQEHFESQNGTILCCTGSFWAYKGEFEQRMYSVAARIPNIVRNLQKINSFPPFQ